LVPVSINSAEIASIPSPRTAVAGLRRAGYNP
jgi:hypothetical protein